MPVSLRELPTLPEPLGRLGLVLTQLYALAAADQRLLGEAFGALDPEVRRAILDYLALGKAWTEEFMQRADEIEWAAGRRDTP